VSSIDDEIVLRSSDGEVGVLPALGGALSHWRVRGTDVLRPRIAGSPDPTDSACFALAPFSNFVSDGILRFRNDRFALPPNHPKEPLFIHGDAWLGAWSVNRAAKHFAEIRYDHERSRGFPFRYSVSQSIRVDQARLAISLVLRNADHRSMPAGLGLHPYFSRSKGVRLRAAHAGLWLDGAVHRDARFLHDDPLGEVAIDDCFIEWTRSACLALPELRRRITISASAAAQALVVYSPLGADFICVEPVTHVNDGINCMADGVEATGVQVLEPGGSMQLDVDLQIDHLNEGAEQERIHR
jgi:aldose 1-epimerase